MENSPHGLHRNGLKDVLSPTYINTEAAKGIKKTIGLANQNCKRERNLSKQKNDSKSFITEREIDKVLFISFRFCRFHLFFF